MHAFHRLCLLSACLYIVRANDKLHPVPQGFPAVWNDDRFDKEPCEIIQAPPKWLEGYLLSQVSASYGDQSAPDGQKVTHLLDAIGAVASVEIGNNYSLYSATYYPTRPYKIWNFYDREWSESSVPWNTFFSTTNVTAKKMWDSIAKKGRMETSPKIDFWRVGQDIIAGTEVYDVGLTFDVETLTNFKPYEFKEASKIMSGEPLEPIHMAMHKRVNPDNGRIWASALAVNTTAKPLTFHRVLFSVEPNGLRKVEGIYDYEGFNPSNCRNGLYTGNKRNLPRYMHSITSTENYIILPLTSAVFNPCTVLSEEDYGNEELYTPQVGIDWPFTYESSVPMAFLVFDKSSKKFLDPIEADSARFVSHQSNAYESKPHELVMDMVVHDDDWYQDLTVEKLTAPIEKFPLMGHARRFTLNLNTKSVTNTSFLPIDPSPFAFPAYNHDFEGKKYKYTYGVMYPFYQPNSVVKIDMDDFTGKTDKEFNPPELVSFRAPNFVPRPGGTEEDDGVVVVSGIDASVNKTRIYIVDGKTFEQVGHILAPAMTPFGFHTRFYTKEMLGIKSNCNSKK